MSKVSDSLRVNLERGPAEMACRRAIAQSGWRILEDADRIVVKEVSPSGMSFTNAAKVALRISDTPGDGSVIELDGSITGMGPVQKGHLRGQVGALRNRIEVAAAAYAPAPTGGPSVELERLAALHRSGALSDDEFARAKARTLAG